MAQTPGSIHDLTFSESYVVPVDNTRSPFAPAVVYRESHVPMNPIYFGKTVTSGGVSYIAYTHSQTASGLVSLAGQTSSAIL